MEIYWLNQKNEEVQILQARNEYLKNYTHRNQSLLLFLAAKFRTCDEYGQTGSRIWKFLIHKVNVYTFASNVQYVFPSCFDIHHLATPQFLNVSLNRNTDGYFCKKKIIQLKFTSTQGVKNEFIHGLEGLVNGPACIFRFFSLVSSLSGGP